jgi:uncharacterized membrane protein
VIQSSDSQEQFPFPATARYNARVRFWKKQPQRSWLAGAVIGGAAAVGMVDSFYLLLEFIEVLLHPGEPTPCTVSSLVSCTLTVQGPYGHYLPGIPNPMWGMLWYAGFVAYGVSRLLGSTFTRRARMFVGIILVLGMMFSYRLYLASVLELGGVCPFCLISTTVSTLISLAFVVDDRSYPDPLLGRASQVIFSVYQLFSVLAFVVGLPLFIGSGLRWMPDPMEAVTHWSFPVMTTLVIIMAVGHIWAFRKLRNAR